MLFYNTLLAFIAGVFGFLGVFFSAVGIVEAGFSFRLVDVAGIILGLAGAFLGVKYATS